MQHSVIITVLRHVSKLLLGLGLFYQYGGEKYVYLLVPMQVAWSGACDWWDSAHNINSE